MDEYDDLLSISDDELRRRIMRLLKKKCDSAGIEYPYKLVRYLAEHGGQIPARMP